MRGSGCNRLWRESRSVGRRKWGRRARARSADDRPPATAGRTKSQRAVLIRPLMMLTKIEPSLIAQQIVCSRYAAGNRAVPAVTGF